ncbi:MAG: hypothetical protein U1F56_05165 [Rubrivivax sp.]
MHLSTSRLALALSLAFAGPATWAQAAITDGSSNTIVAGERGAGSLTTSASSALTVTQRGAGTATSGGGQTLAVGSALDATILRGTVNALGVASGSVTQTRDANSAVTSAQTLTIGSVSGTLDATQVTADGALQGSLTQTSRRGGPVRGSEGQRVDIGSLSDAGGGNLAAQGRVLGASTTITQDHSGQTQLLRVGSIGSSTLLSGNASGLLSGTVVQSGNGASGANALQAIDIGSIGGSQANAVATVGVVDGRITQAMVLGNDREQRIAVAAVRNADAAGRITAGGTVRGELSQTGTADALVRVGAVEGGSPGTVTTQGSFSGSAITQNSSSAGLQRVDIAAALAISGQATTQGDVTGRIAQNLATVGARDAVQVASVGSAEGTRGSVATRALLSGDIAQTSRVGLSSDQQVLVGSVLNTGTLTVRTDATVTGNVTQTADGVGERQRAIFGGAVGR